MGERSGKKSDGSLPDNQTQLPSLEQELENQDISQTDQNERETQADTIEKKSIKNILFVDDEESVRKLFKEALEKFGYKVTVAANGNEGKTLFRENPADLIITDLFMPEEDGHTFIYEITQEFPDTKILAITGKNTLMGMEGELKIAQMMGAIRGFTKPVRLRDLLDAIKAL